MPYVRADVATMLAMIASAPGPQMHESSPELARTTMRQMTQFAERPRGPLPRVVDIAIPSPHGEAIPARLYGASAVPEAGPVVVYYHGGAWVIGDLDTHDSLCAEIARGLGLTVVSIDYRLAPEHPFPAATEDCLAATRWIAGSPPEIGHAVTGVIPAGDSAGGNLAAVVSQQLGELLPVPIVAQWLIYPGTDMTANTGSMREFSEGYLLTHEGMRWFTEHYMGSAPDFTHPYASPLHAETLAGQPPTLVFTCGLDPLRDQGRAYAAKLVGSGVRTIFREAAGQVHGCMTIRAGIPSAHGDLLDCLADLRVLLGDVRADDTARAAA